MYLTTNLARSQHPRLIGAATNPSVLPLPCGALAVSEDSSLIGAGAGVSPSPKARSLTTYHISLKNLLYADRVFETNIYRRYVGGDLIELEAKDPIKISEIDPVAQTRSAGKRINKKLLASAGSAGVQDGDQAEVVDPGKRPSKRGRVGGYSYRSRRRMQKSVARLDKTRLRKPKMLTLTFPRHGSYSDNPIEWKKALDVFIERHLKVSLPDNFFVLWKMEPQDRGAPHFHLLIFSDDSKTLNLIYQWRYKWKKAWYQLIGSGDRHHYHWGAWVGFGQHKGRRVQNFRNWRGVASYVSKYLGKTTPEGWEGFKDQEGNSIPYAGRFWGIYNRRFYDRFVQPVEVQVSRRQSEMLKGLVIALAVDDLKAKSESHLFKMTPDERKALPHVRAELNDGFRRAFDSEAKEAEVKVEIPDSYHFRKYIMAYKQAVMFKYREYDTCGLSCFVVPNPVLIGASEVFGYPVGEVPPVEVTSPPPPPPDIEVVAEQLAFPFDEEAVADAVSAYYSVGSEADV